MKNFEERICPARDSVEAPFLRRDKFASELILVAFVMFGMLFHTFAYSAENPESGVSTDYVDDSGDDSVDEHVEGPVSPAAAGLLEKFDDGEYWVVGSDGLDLLKKEPHNNALRLAVADSLAWTERYDDAIRQYQLLADTTLSDKAALGLANVYQWSGRPDLARPLYQKVLTISSSDPETVAEAVDGLNTVNRQLRATTDVKRTIKSDSNTVSEHGFELDHFWRGDDSAAKYGFSLNSNRYKMTSTAVDTPQRDLNFSVEHPGVVMAPKLALSVQHKPFNKEFASLRLKPIAAANLHMTMGHVNWGNMEFQPQGLLAGLSANQLGIDGGLITRLGSISALYNNYQVSDRNRVWEENLKFFPSWKPLGEDFRYYLGLEGRRARTNVDTYWSPTGGYRGLGYQSYNIGFEYELSVPSGAYSIRAERGFHAAGEAALSYDIGLDAKRYIGRNWAVLLSAGSFRNQRTANAYRYTYVNFGIERLW